MNILIVDDEPALVEFLTTTVSAYYPSHSVRGAVSATEAIGAAYEEGYVDLLITDLDLGESNGFEVRSQLEPIFPDMQTLFISGSEMANSVVDGTELMRKPIDASAIFGAVEAFQRKVIPKLNRPLGNTSHDVPSAPVPITSFPVALQHRESVPSPVCAVVPPIATESESSPSPRPTRIALPAVLSVLALAAVVALVMRENRAVPVSQFPIEAQSSAAFGPESTVPIEQPDLSRLAPIPFSAEAESPVPGVIFDEGFEGPDRALEFESHWEVLPMAPGAFEFIAGDGFLRARSSDLVIALFDAATASPSIDWRIRVGLLIGVQGRAGLIFGYRNPTDYYEIVMDGETGRASVIRRFSGEMETLWEGMMPVVDGSNELRAAFDGREHTLEIEGNAIELPNFEGGRFGIVAAETPIARFSEWELSLVSRD